MSALDGNAIAGQLATVFGDDMTTATGSCAACGASAPIAELTVYLKAPGTVVRCRRCDSILIVLVTIRNTTCVDLRGLGALLPAGGSEPQGATGL